MVSAYENALHSLWSGVCNVYVRQSIVNETNGRNEPAEVLVHENVPCRLSHSSVSSTSENSSAAQVLQTVKLFLPKDIAIQPGSKLTITQNGKTENYVKSGQPAVYSRHQEITLELFKGWV